MAFQNNMASLIVIVTDYGLSIRFFQEYSSQIRLCGIWVFEIFLVNSTTGQLISKGHFGNLKSNKKTTKFLKNFCPSLNKKSNKEIKATYHAK